ncbi:uncharacterized protein BDZ99DRAFT_310831 [Mytilinidion resinicola]|uniref:Uncharacterized protein n=1 Tax=Mytilinidion resinicola TaxID=574789 RepID=A0A6A6YQW3_9PEZI|nr:uncharacterized protein BDZ99DRAFT_310831 [Mytilinidion resinicola]KAF2810404.1 hypothetical protein BDZ99DRAFT_310831 [Mytilinidion resinicola]
MGAPTAGVPFRRLMLQWDKEYRQRGCCIKDGNYNVWVNEVLLQSQLDIMAAGRRHTVFLYSVAPTALLSSDRRAARHHGLLCTLERI